MRAQRRKFAPQVYANIIKRQKGLCACGCGEPLGSDPRGFQFDHELSLELEGEDTPENLRALKVRHHMAKTAREATARAKVKRIAARDGMRMAKLSAKGKVLARMLESRQ